MFRNFLAVGVGGAVGAMLRYAMTLLVAYLHWPATLSTFLVNIVGSFAMGMLVSSCSSGTWLLLATVGICGGFTTFSTFSMQSVTLLQEGKWGQAALYIFGTLIICILMAALGYFLGSKIK